MGAKETKQLRRDSENLKRNDPTLRSLDYEGIQLGDSGASALGLALRGNTHLRKLLLGRCNIGPEGLHNLVRCLCEDRLVPSRLRKLELSTSSTPTPQGNPIGDEGANSLALLLASSTSLHHLRVAACSIGDGSAVSIAKALAQNSTLKTLDLSCNGISDKGAEELGSALKRNSSLRGLLLWNNQVFHTGAESLAIGLASNSSLQWLGLGCNHIGDEGVKAISLALLSNAQSSGLIWLALGGNGITDKGAEHLSFVLKIQHAPTGLASDKQVETSSLTEQIRLGKLRPMLDLGVTPSQVTLHGSSDELNSPILEEEEEQGKGNTREDRTYCVPLQSLGLGGNKITCLGAGYLADGLKTNTNLLSLGLADNRISNEGAAALAELVRHTDTLQKVTLSGNDIQDQGGSTLMAALTQNTSLQGLYLAGNPCGDVVGERCQEVVGRHNHTLQSLDLHDIRMTTPAVSELLNTMRTEKVLRALGSQPLPLPGAKGHAPIPLTGNMLEMEEWQPRSLHSIILKKKGQRFPSTAPSQRLNTLDVLGSLPEPEETAQTMVVRQSQVLPRKRRGSISQFLKRKLSKKKHDIPTGGITPVPSSQKKRSNTAMGMEMHPLVEEGNGAGMDNVDDVIEESAMEQEVDDTFRSPTVIVENDARFPIRLDVLLGDVDDTESTSAQSTTPQPTSTQSTYPLRPANPSQPVTQPIGPLQPISPPQRTQPPSTQSIAPCQSTSTSKIDHPKPIHPTVFDSLDRTTPTISMATESRMGSVTTSSMYTDRSFNILEKATPTAAMAMESRVGSIATSSMYTDRSFGTLERTTPTLDAVTESRVGSIATSSMYTERSFGMPERTTPTVDTVIESRVSSVAIERSVNAVSDEDEMDLNVIPRTESLENLTRDRPKPPPNRRTPSKYKTPSPSPAHTGQTGPVLPTGRGQPGQALHSQATSSLSHTHTAGQTSQGGSPFNRSMAAHGKVERIGGITNTVQEDGSQRVGESPRITNASARPAQTIKEQWATGLQKRMGVLKMGGFLHRGFDTIMSDEIGKDHDFTLARLPCNDHKNRLVAPLPPAHTRVKMQLVAEELGSDYINASYVGPSTAPKHFIVTQAPIPSTFGDFWRLIWERRVGVVVVLTKEDEVDGWWPEEGDQHSYSLVVGRTWRDNSLLVSTVDEQVNSVNPDLIVRSLTLESLADDESDTVKIFHYSNWPQYGIVENRRDVSGLVRHVLAAKSTQKYTGSPVVVVSKLGGGRAGCFCVLSLAYELMTFEEEPNIPEDWKKDSNIIDQIIRSLRECRGELVCSQKQYEFCHRALEEVMWGRPASMEELDTWEKHRGKKDRKKWKMFGKKEKGKDSKSRQKNKKKRAKGEFEHDISSTNLLF